MRFFLLVLGCMVFSVPSASAVAQEAASRGSASAKSSEEDKKKADDKKADDEKTVVTHHEAKIGGRTWKYRVTAGLMPIRDAEDKTEAHIFYMAYTAEDPDGGARRPVMFSFNGGPGSASVWLHLGALGPRRVEVPSDAGFARPPFRLVDNEESWLDQTDLVFIDPVGTGFSRAEKPELRKKFFSLQGDIDSVGEFIRLYLTRNERWDSPLFLVGESYGTTRAAGLAGHLVDRGIAFNGIVLVSSVLDFQTLSFRKGNELPYVLYVPAYTAAAWFHKKLPDDLQGDLRSTLEKAERWATTEYARAINRGDRLTDQERREVIAQLAKFTGLEPRFLDEADLRVTTAQFCRELLRREKRTVGRFDSRYQGSYGLDVTQSPGYDPSLAAVMPAYTAMLNQYVRKDLGFKTDAVYHILGTGIGPWSWGSDTSMGYPQTSDALRTALEQNPHMKVFVASGYYDLATPYTGTEHMLAHLGIDPVLRKNVRTEWYEAGHMMYNHRPSLAKLKSDVTSFLREAQGR